MEAIVLRMRPAAALAILVWLTGCKPASRDPAEAASPLDRAREEFEKGVAEKNPLRRAGLLRRAAGRLEKAGTGEAYLLRARIRREQGLFHRARLDAGRAIGKGVEEARRFRFVLNTSAAFNAVIGLDLRHDPEWFEEAREDLKTFGTPDPLLDAWTVLFRGLSEVSETEEPYERTVIVRMREAPLEALQKLKGLTDDVEALLLRARLSAHLAAHSLTPADEQKNHRERMERDLERARALAPMSALVKWVNLLCRLTIGEHDEARRQAEELTRWMPDSAQPWVALSQMQLRSGESEEAFKSLEEAGRRAERPADPALWKAMTLMGGFLTNATGREPRVTAREHGEALALLTKALKVDPDDPLPLYYRGWLRVRDTATVVEGIEDFRRYVGRHPRTLLARFAREYTEPATDDARAVRRFKIARAVTKSGHLEDGLVLYKALLEDVRKADKMMMKTRLMFTCAYNIACICSQRDQLDEALKFLEQAIQAGFSDFEVARTDPDLEKLRRDPRFENLLKKYSGK